MHELTLANALAASALAPQEDRETLLAMTDDQVRAGVRAGDPEAMRALVAQVDDFVDNDPMLVELSRQLRRGGGPGCLNLHGNATWAPVRDPRADWSEWGDWEVWEECAIGPVNDGKAIGAIPTGGWLSWNSAVPDQILGVPASTTNVRKKAEIMAVIQNAGKRTRVVLANGEASASELVFGEIAAKVGAEMERLRAETPEG
jgi:hypothetical protein